MDTTVVEEPQVNVVTMSRRRRIRLLLVGLVAVGLAVSACGTGSDGRQQASPTGTEGEPDSALLAPTDFSQSRGVIVANTAGTITTAGTQRVMTAIIGPDDRPFLGGPDAPVTIDYREVDGGSVLQAEGMWLTTNASALGLYITTVDFPAAGQWDVVVLADGAEIARTSLTVNPESAVPMIGEQAPPADSPTGATRAEIAAISTDPEPDPALYQLSIMDAVGNGRPTVIAFVTPGFCQTALCGPTLEAVKSATADQPGLDVLHVEPFDLESARAGELRPVPAMADWGLQTEPWVFVIDADGSVHASFEGIIGQEELEAAVARLGIPEDETG